MRRHDCARDVGQVGRIGGFAFQDIDGGTASRPPRNAATRSVVRTNAPRDVLTRIDPGLHPVEPLAVEEPARLGRHREVQAERRPRRPGVRRVRPTRSVPSGVAAAYGSYPTMRPPSGQKQVDDGAADPPETDNAEGELGETRDGAQSVQRPRRLATALDPPRPSPDGGQDQGERVRGNFLHAIVGHVRHDDPGIAGSIEVEVVHADPVTGDGFRQRASRAMSSRPRQVGVEQRVGSDRGVEDSRAIAVRNDEVGVDLLEHRPLKVYVREYLVRK